MTPPTRHFTQSEVAELRCCHIDTVKRDRRAGKYPNARQRPGDPSRTWEIPAGDLVAAGQLDPADLVEDEAPLERSRALRELAQLREQLAAEVARREAIEAQLADRNGFITFLQQTIASLTTLAKAA